MQKLNVDVEWARLKKARSGASRASLAIRCSFVDPPYRRSVSSWSFSLQRFRAPVLLFPPRGPSGQFPRFIGNVEALRLPIALPASLRCLRSAVPRRRPSIRSHGRSTPDAREPGPFCCPPSRHLATEAVGSPRFLDEPLRACPRSPQTLGGSRRPAILGTLMLPPR